MSTTVLALFEKPVELHSCQDFTWSQSSNIASPLLPWMIIIGLENNADPLNYVSFFLNGKYGCITFQFILRGICKEYQKWDGGSYHTCARIIRMVCLHLNLCLSLLSHSLMDDLTHLWVPSDLGSSAYDFLIMRFNQAKPKPWLQVKHSPGRWSQRLGE